MKNIYKYPNTSLFLNVGAVLFFVYVYLTNDIDTFGKVVGVILLIKFLYGIYAALKRKNDGIYINKGELLVITKGRTQVINIVDISSIVFETNRKFSLIDFENSGTIIAPKITLKNGTVFIIRYHANTQVQNDLITALYR